MAIKSNKFDKITPEGRRLMESVILNGKYNPISGSMGWNMKDGGIVRGQIITANILDDNGDLITTKEQYLNALIKWFEEYGNQYNVNPNILAAQSYKESTFRTYAYAQPSTAMGVTQFLVGTIRDVIIGNLRQQFNQEEIGEITKDIVLQQGTTITSLKNYYIVKDPPPSTSRSSSQESLTAYGNKVILYRNVTNNPKIMIKAQALLLNTIARNHKDLAASALFLYFAGPNITYPDGNSSFISNNFGDLFDKTLKKSSSTYPINVVVGGLEYARGIIDILSKDKGISLKGNKYSFGFDVDRTVVTGSELVDPSKSLALRVEPSEKAGIIS